jgi:methylmalonyl-CoA mutase
MSVQKPDFDNISLFDEHDFITKEQWQQQVKNGIDTSIDDLLFETNEQIQLKPLYTSDDREGIQHLDDLPGIPPYTRGPYPTMYVNRPCRIFDS